MPHDHDTHSPAQHSHGQSDDQLIALLDLDAEVLHDYWTDALDWVRQAAQGSGWHRLLDLGAGTGTGAIGLARRFDNAEVLAVDSSAESLHRLDEKIAQLGLAVQPIEADFDAGWPELGTLDLIWASMSLHHMADPERTLRQARATTRSGGLIAVAEFPVQLHFLPDDLGIGRPGFEQRAGELLGQSHRELMPTLGSAWAPRLAETGWQVFDERDFVIEQNPATHPRAGAYAEGWFSRLSHRLTDVLEPEDRQTLARLLDPEDPFSIRRRTDLHIRGVRTITLARNA
jgi:ubiquinone/menaquinone biosynthesis C-methylase UbiE